MKLNEILKNIDTCVICSTQNQIVNYIPIKLIEKYNDNKKIEIFNITLEDRSENNSFFKRFNNSLWDENLKFCLENLDYITYNDSNYIKIQRNSLDISKEINSKLNLDEGISELNLKVPKERKILWNITGGQRSTTIAIQDYIRKNNRNDDRIIYLEGNSNRIVCGKLEDKNNFKYYLLKDSYELEDLNLNRVFQLSGFTIRNYNECTNLLKRDENNNILEYDRIYDELKNNHKGLSKEEFELCGQIYKHYKKDTKNLREILIKLNKKANADNRVMEELWNKLKDYDESGFNETDKKVLESLKGDSNEKFGYILEYMTLYAIREAINNSEDRIKNYFIELCHSVNIDKLKNPVIQAYTKELCEFDIVLLCRSGQVVIFECKSGTMSSDVGKARQYTGYAVAGVYGKPVLITPLLKKDRELIYKEFRKDKSDKVHEKSTKGKSVNDIYDETILQSIRAAFRANLEVWGIDEIVEKLEELYKEAL